MRRWLSKDNKRPEATWRCRRLLLARNVLSTNICQAYHQRQQRKPCEMFLSRLQYTAAKCAACRTHMEVMGRWIRDCPLAYVCTPFLPTRPGLRYRYSQVFIQRSAVASRQIRNPLLLSKVDPAWILGGHHLEGAGTDHQTRLPSVSGYSIKT